MQRANAFSRRQSPIEVNLAGDIVLFSVYVCRFVVQPGRRGGMLGRRRAEAVRHGRADSRRGGREGEEEEGRSY